MLALGETSGTKFSTEQNVPRAVTIDRDWIICRHWKHRPCAPDRTGDRVDVSIVIRCYYLPPEQLCSNDADHRSKSSIVFVK